MENNKIGYVYVLSWSENEHKIKIGKTKNHPEVRVSQLNRQTGTVGKYKVEWFVELKEYDLLEKFLHSIFSDYHSEKEFFDISFENSKEVLENISKRFKVLYAIGRSILRRKKRELMKDLSNLDEAEDALKTTLELCENEEEDEKKLLEKELLRIRENKVLLKKSLALLK